MQLSKSTSLHVLTIVTTTCLLTGGAVVTSSAAHAGLPRDDKTNTDTDTCWSMDWTGLAAELRTAGLSAQAANVSAQLIRQDCLPVPE